MTKFYGTGVALITPFKTDLSVDYNALKNIVNYNIDNGTNYLVVSGTTGESVTVTKEEKKKITNTVIETNKGRLPIVLGIGGNNTMAVIEEIKSTDFSQIDAILSVSPYYSKPTQEGLYQHFKAIAKASPVPVILYNVPGRTSKNMLPETTIRLANDFENIIAVKEAGNNVAQYLQLLKDKPEDFLVISGDDDLAWEAGDPMPRDRASLNLDFHYDFQNRLVRVSRDGVGDLARYDYDAQNRRVRRIVGGVTREVSWSGWQAVEEYVGRPEISGTVAFTTILLLLAIAVLAGFFPARRASRGRGRRRGRRATWRPSRCEASRSTGGRTSGPSAPCCTRC